MVKIGKAKLKYMGLTILLVIFIVSIIFIANSNITGLVIKDNIIENNCKEFKENILWNGEYSNKPQGSTKYHVWYPKYNCTEIDISDCLLKDIEVKTRFLFLGENKEVGEGNIQISEPDNSICDNPEKGNYLQYLSYESLEGINISLNHYCKNTKKINNEKCTDQNYKKYVDCYGIKIYSTPKMIIDVLEIRYNLCKEED